MGAMYGTVTGTHGFMMDQAPSDLRGGEYYELQHWTQRSSTGRFSADLESQLFAGDGYWASSDAAYIFSDAFPTHLLVMYEPQVSVTNDAQVRLAAVRGDINAPPERQIHILHDWRTGHYRLLERMENTHIDDLRNTQFLGRLRDLLWAQRVFDETPNPQAYVPSIIPVQHRLNLSSAVGNRAAAQQLLYETPAHADDQEGDAAAEDSTERPIKTRALAIPRIVQKPEFRQVNGINFKGVRLNRLSKSALEPSLPKSSDLVVDAHRSYNSADAG